jgi:Uma2 family endonuclease
MPAATASRNGRGARAEPAWEVARIFPNQGNWDEVEYLALTAHTNHLVEFRDGHVEVLPMPKTSHQLIVAYLYRLLVAFTSARKLGKVLFAALRVRLRPKLYREPDIVFMLAEHAVRIGEDYWEGADLVMEVVSGDPKDRHRDLVTKRREYASAGIPEYWIVDPEQQRITVLRLAGKARSYSVHGVYGPGEKATATVLKGFSVEVSKVLDAGKGKD